MLHFEAAKDAAVLGPRPTESIGRAREEVMHVRTMGKFRLTVEWDGRALRIVLEPY